MKSYLDYLNTSDIDWYGIDKNELILHFASGGGKVPSSIIKNGEANVQVAEYFKNCSNLNTEILISKNLKNYVSFFTTEQAEYYLEDFILMAQKGLYSFDKSNLGKLLDKMYHLVAIPPTALKLSDVPLEIASILKKTQINKDIKSISSISVAATNWS